MFICLSVYVLYVLYVYYVCVGIYLFVKTQYTEYTHAQLNKCTLVVLHVLPLPEVDIYIYSIEVDIYIYSIG